MSTRKTEGTLVKPVDYATLRGPISNNSIISTSLDELMRQYSESNRDEVLYLRSLWQMILKVMSIT